MLGATRPARDDGRIVMRPYGGDGALVQVETAGRRGRRPLQRWTDVGAERSVGRRGRRPLQGWTDVGADRGRRQELPPSRRLRETRRATPKTLKEGGYGRAVFEIFEIFSQST